MIAEIAKALENSYNANVDHELERLEPLPASIASIYELHDFIEARKRKYLSDETFSIDHSGCEIENEFDSLLFHIAQKAFDLESREAGKFRRFKPVVQIIDNPHRYGRPYKLIISEIAND